MESVTQKRNRIIQLNRQEKRRRFTEENAAIGSRKIKREVIQVNKQPSKEGKKRGEKSRNHTKKN